MFSILEIASETGANYTGEDAIVTSVSTDTRDLPEGCIFIALKGDHFDGHNFIGEALGGGAAFAVSMEKEAPPNDRVLYVKDTRDALLGIARLHRRKTPAKAVGITGSSGKTTTKEMIANVLSSELNTIKTEKNLNNEIGLSKTILRLDESTEAAVFEMGIDGPGQMARMSKSALPDIAVITNIGVTHIEAFGTRERILNEKIDITAGLKDGGTLILCGDNDLLRPLKRTRFNVIKYGITNANATVRAKKIQEYAGHTEFTISWDGKSFDAGIPALGRHNVLNALAAFCVGVSLDLKPQNIITALRSYRPEGMRQNIVRHNSLTIVEDCYNANPDSMRAALTTLGNMRCDGRRIAVLSDMGELGAIAESSHFETGEFAARCGLDYLLCTGRLSEGYVAGARDAGMSDAFHYETQELLLKAIKSLASPGDIFWFKASRSMKLEDVMQQIYHLKR